MSHKKTVVPLIDRVGDLVRNLNGALQARDAVLMAALYGELTSILERAFAGDDYSFKRLNLYCEASLCSIRYKIFNNMNGSAAEEGRKTVEMLDAVIAYSNEYSDDEMARLREIRESVRGMVENLPPHKNRVVNRLDSCCRLCRVRPANKTGSHMVPNFLAHPSFSWDGKGKRDHEALNHDFMNAPEANCTFYGREVPEWRFAQGEGKSAVTEADVAANINQLEFDNEFCSMCEGRFGILESAYSQYYNGVQRSVDPRVAYLFWLSVLWRMSIGSIGIFMDMDDELELRDLLDAQIGDSARAIAAATSDLGEWKYAIFRAEGLSSNGDKGILGYRRQCSPYVVMYNDLVMVFYNGEPSESDLSIGPICVERENLNDWRSPEKSRRVDRRWFWDVRDWIVESSYDFYDPVKERTLVSIREQERSQGIVISDWKKAAAVEAARLENPPRSLRFRFRKSQRIALAWMRLKEAADGGASYDPLADEELFLTSRDFEMYFDDLAYFSKYGPIDADMSSLPFYDEARRHIPDEERWSHSEDSPQADPEYERALRKKMSGMNRRQLLRFAGAIATKGGG